MTKVRVHEDKPWEPSMDSLPMFNPFVSPVEHLGDVKVPVEDGAPEYCAGDAAIEPAADGAMTDLAEDAENAAPANGIVAPGEAATQKPEST